MVSAIEFQKKKKERGKAGTAAEMAAAIEPRNVPTANLPAAIAPAAAPQTNVLAERFAGANVIPNQPGMPANINAELKGIYANQVMAGRPELENQRAARLADLRTQAFNTAINQIGNVTPQMEQQALMENAPASLTQGIIPQVAANVGSKAAIGAAGGAAAGLFGGAAAPATVPAGAIIGGTAGAIAGMSSLLTSLKEEAIQNTKVQRITYSNAKTNIKAIIDGVNKGLIDPVDAISLYNRELAKIDRAERNLKSLSESEWLSKAQDELTAIQSFNNFERARMGLTLQQAIVQPNPNINFELPAETLTEQ